MEPNPNVQFSTICCHKGTKRSNLGRVKGLQFGRFSDFDDVGESHERKSVLDFHLKQKLYQIIRQKLHQKVQISNKMGTNWDQKGPKWIKD